MNKRAFLKQVVVILCLLQGFACNTGLKEEDFSRIAGEGVDDRLNSYPWAMEQFDGDGDGTPEVYVGTLGNALCIQAPLMAWIELLCPLIPYRPPVRWQCRNDLWGDPRDLASWEPYYEATNSPVHVFRGTYNRGKGTWAWERVWDPPYEQVGGFRGARVFDDALYLTGNGLEGAYVYKTTDGDHFHKASPPGMGAVAGQGGFRGAQVFRDKLYISSDSACMIFCSADPSTDPAAWEQANSTGFVSSGGGVHSGVYASGTVDLATTDTLTDDTGRWMPFSHVGRQVRILTGTGAGQTRSILTNDRTTLWVAAEWDTVPDATSQFEIFEMDTPDNHSIWQLAVFNDHLYAITNNNETGPECWKTTDPAPGNWTRVVEGGFGNSGMGFMTIRPFRDHVYIGTFTYPPFFGTGAAIQGTEIIRLDANDNVELVVGKTREAGVIGPDPVEPLSGIGPGFDQPSNFYSWYMGEHHRWFYVGTCDFNGMGVDAIAEFFGGEIPPEIAWLVDLIAGPTGFDLWRTRDGINWIKVSDTGFGEHDNYGIRNLLSTRWGLLVGVANAVDGFEIWAGRKWEPR